MLTAIRVLTSTRIYAKSAAPADAPFICPGCQQPVTLRRPRQRAVANFAHHPGSECSYARGETSRHLEVKDAIFEALRAQGILAETEHELGNARADVYYRLGGRETVIEVQHSRITIEDIDHRMRKHAAAGRAVIWVLTSPVPVKRAVVSIPRWTRHVTALSLGVGFHHHGGRFLWPVAYRRATRFIPEYEYFDTEVRDYQLAGGYEQAFLGKRRAYPGPGPIDLTSLTHVLRRDGLRVGVLPYEASSWNRRRYPQHRFNLQSYGGVVHTQVRSEAELIALVSDREFLTDSPIIVRYVGPPLTCLDGLRRTARAKAINIAVSSDGAH